MKIKIGFFYSNISDVFNILKNTFSIIIYSFCLTVFCIVLSSRLNIKENIFNLASNAINIDSNDELLKGFKTIYPVFNEDNYIVENTDDEIIEGNEKEIIENEIQENIISYSNDYERIDDINTDVSSLLNIEDNLNIDIKDGDTQKLNVNGVKINNKSSKRDFDFNNLFSKVINLTKQTDKILLYNTHTSEAYKNSENYQFEYSGTYRSKDAKYNMLSVSKILTSNLNEKGFNVVTNTTPHDYASYNSSYINSRRTYLSEIEKHKSFGIAIDLHRDAGASLDFAPKVNINGIEVAKCMIVLGIGPENKRNQYMEDNLSLALKLQMLAEQVYPGLFRDMLVKDSIYNQDIASNSILIEVGATGNTLDEAYLATRCLSNLLDLIYVD